MTTATELLRARRFGVRDFKTHISERIKSSKPMVIIDHGQPKKVVLDYEEYIGTLEFIEELQDKELLSLVQQGRASLKSGHVTIDAEKSLSRIRSSKKKI